MLSHQLISKYLLSDYHIPLEDRMQPDSIYDKQKKSHAETSTLMILMLKINLFLVMSGMNRWKIWKFHSCILFLFWRDFLYNSPSFAPYIFMLQTIWNISRHKPFFNVTVLRQKYSIKSFQGFFLKFYFYSGCFIWQLNFNLTLFFLHQGLQSISLLVPVF